MIFGTNSMALSIWTCMLNLGTKFLDVTTRLSPLSHSLAKFAYFTIKNSNFLTGQKSRNLVGIGLYRLDSDCLHPFGLEWSEIVLGRYNSRNFD